MQNVLLTSSSFIKSITNISDNVSDKMILPCLREAQDIDLKGVIGETLLDRLKELIRENEINETENAAYKDLLEKCQYFLSYQTVSRLCVVLSVKIDAMGLMRDRDENLDYIEMSDVFQLEEFYQKKADTYKKFLQNFLLDNRTAFPELNECSCNKIKANLYSAASSAIFLGNRRGKILDNKGLCGKG